MIGARSKKTYAIFQYMKLYAKGHLWDEYYWRP